MIATFTKSEYRRLDGFQARCLRQILKIQPAYYSRVSNATVRKITGIQASYWSRISNSEVLSRVHGQKLSVLLLEQQVKSTASRIRAHWQVIVYTNHATYTEQHTIN